MKRALIGIALALVANSASAVYKCESPGRPPSYQEGPCPPATQETKIGPQSQRDRSLAKAAKDREEKAAREKMDADNAVKQRANEAAEKERLNKGVAELSARRQQWMDAKSKLRVGMTSAQLEALHPYLVHGDRIQRTETASGTDQWITFNEGLTIHLHNGIVASIHR